MGGIKVKKESTLKVILSVLVIVLLTLVSGMGVYVKDRNVMKNKLPDYKYGMEINAVKRKKHGYGDI